MGKDFWLVCRKTNAIMRDMTIEVNFILLEFVPDQRSQAQAARSQTKLAPGENDMPTADSDLYSAFASCHDEFWPRGHLEGTSMLLQYATDV